MHTRAYQTRRSSIPGFILVALLTLLIGSHEVNAQVGIGGSDDQDAPPLFLIGITGHGNANFYSMTVLSEAIKIVNDEISSGSTQGVSFDEITGGTSIGAGIRIFVKDKYLLEATYDSYFGSSKIGGTTISSEISTPLKAWMFTGGIDLVEGSKTRFGVMGGIGLYSSSAKQLYASDDEELDRIEFEGDTMGYHAGVFFETGLTHSLNLSIAAGYRSAKIDEIDITATGAHFTPLGLGAGVDSLKIEVGAENRIITTPMVEEVTVDGESVLQFRGGNTELDWSGLMLQIAFTVYLNVPGFE